MFTAILFIISAVVVLTTLYALGNTSEAVHMLYPHKVGQFVRRRLAIALGFALWGLYRICG